MFKMHKIILVFAAILLACNSAVADKKIVCYFTNSAIYRVGKGKIDVSNLDPQLCSHLIYLYAKVTWTGDLAASDPYADLPENGGRNGYSHFNELRSVNPKLKTLLAVGALGFSAEFSNIAANPSVRQNFVNNVYNFVQKYGFNGVDLQWAYPNQDGRNPSRKRKFWFTFERIEKSFSWYRFASHGNSHWISSLAYNSYNISQVMENLDFGNVIAYDLHGSWNGVTGINSPLYPGSWETGWARYANIDAIVTYWVSKGAPSEKIVVSLSTYGRSFTLESTNSSGIGASAQGPGSPGPYTRVPGLLAYYEICESLAQGGWTYNYQSEQRVPYAVNGNQWVGYDNVQSIGEKIMYIRNKNLGGAAFYTLDTDDFGGVCGEKYPLLKAALNITNSVY